MLRTLASRGYGASSVLFRRWASTAQGASRSPATAILDDKISDLTKQLEKEDAYMGPITDSQKASDVEYGDASHIRPDLDKLRVVPQMMSFYMANPALEEALRTLRKLVARYTDLPLVPEHEYERPVWIDPSTLYGETKAGLSTAERDEFFGLLDRLNRIEPQLQPVTLRSLIYEMKDKNSIGVTTSSSSAAGATANQPMHISALIKKQLDSLGRSVTVGRRKTASARVIMARAREGQPGQIQVNGMSIEKAFAHILQRQTVLYPLMLVNAFTKFNIFATVQGGGMSGKADAVALGIAKGICVQNPLLVNRLLEGGCLQTDAREKERKKPGKAKARKSYGWVKR